MTGVWLAFAFDAVGVPILFPGELGAVPDQETGIARELVRCLRDHLDDQFLTGEVRAGQFHPVHCVGFVELKNDAPRVGAVRGLHGFERGVAGFRDVGPYFVIIGCHGVAALFSGVSHHGVTRQAHSTTLADRVLCPPATCRRRPATGPGQAGRG